MQQLVDEDWIPSEHWADTPSSEVPSRSEMRALMGTASEVASGIALGLAPLTVRALRRLGFHMCRRCGPVTRVYSAGDKGVTCAECSNRHHAKRAGMLAA